MEGLRVAEAKTSAAYLHIAERSLDDAKVLLSHPDKKHCAGAFYLCGYGVECALKALLLNRSTMAQRPKVLKWFYGKPGHDLDAIRKKLRDRGRPIPRHLARAFATVNRWSVSLRYDTTDRTGHETAVFVRHVEQIITWVKEAL
jgi:hypothetical protein